MSGGGAGSSGGARGARPSFLTKLFNIVSDPDSNSIISWSVTGDSFIIWDHIKFSLEISPNNFSHKNIHSFTRQLSNYGFRKIGVKHHWEYENQYFREGKPYLLINIDPCNKNRPERVTRKRVTRKRRRLNNEKITEPNPAVEDCDGQNNQVSEITEELLLDLEELFDPIKEYEFDVFGSTIQMGESDESCDNG